MVGKRMPLASPPAERALQHRAYLQLGLAHPNTRQHFRQSVLGQRRGGPDGRHFLGRLHGPETLDQIGGGHHPGPGSAR